METNLGGQVALSWLKLCPLSQKSPTRTAEDVQASPNYHPPLTLNCPTRPVWIPDEKDPENVEKKIKRSKNYRIEIREFTCTSSSYAWSMPIADFEYWLLSHWRRTTAILSFNFHFSRWLWPRSNESEVSRTRSVFAPMDRNLKSILS